MIKEIKILRFDNCDVAMFDTVSQGGIDPGVRVKHRVFKDEETGAYWHEGTYLTQVLEPCSTYSEYVSERQFWGKVRLVAFRDRFMPDTWRAIAQSVNHLEILRLQDEVKRESREAGA